MIAVNEESGGTDAVEVPSTDKRQLAGGDCRALGAEASPIPFVPAADNPWTAGGARGGVVPRGLSGSTTLSPDSCLDAYCTDLPSYPPY